MPKRNGKRKGKVRKSVAVAAPASPASTVSSASSASFGAAGGGSPTADDTGISITIGHGTLMCYALATSPGQVHQRFVAVAGTKLHDAFREKLALDRLTVGSHGDIKALKGGKKSKQYELRLFGTHGDDRATGFVHKGNLRTGEAVDVIVFDTPANMHKKKSR